VISVLDTTAFSAAMRHEPEIVSFLGGLPPGEFAVVPPVVAEIEFGLRRLDGTSHRYRLLAAQKERLLSAIPLLAWIPAASAQFGAHQGAPGGGRHDDRRLRHRRGGDCPRPRRGSDYRNASTMFGVQQQPTRFEVPATRSQKSGTTAVWGRRLLPAPGPAATLMQAVRNV
jgi:hypothetical protein